MVSYITSSMETITLFSKLATPNQEGSVMQIHDSSIVWMHVYYRVLMLNLKLSWKSIDRDRTTRPRLKFNFEIFYWQPVLLESLIQDVALSWLFQSKASVGCTVLNTVRKLSGFTFYSINIILVAFIAVELDYPRVIIAIVHSKSNARYTVEI